MKTKDAVQAKLRDWGGLDFIGSLELEALCEVIDAQREVDNMAVRALENRVNGTGGTVIDGEGR